MTDSTHPAPLRDRVAIIAQVMQAHEDHMEALEQYREGLITESERDYAADVTSASIQRALDAGVAPTTLCAALGMD